jgi:hypothetical protein
VSIMMSLPPLYPFEHFRNDCYTSPVFKFYIGPFIKNFRIEVEIKKAFQDEGFAPD